MVLRAEVKSKTNADWLRTIDEIHVSERIKRLRQDYFDSDIHVCSDRARLAMEAWEAAAGQPHQLQRAITTKKILEGISLGIHPDELTAGNETPYVRGVQAFVEFYSQALLDEFQGGRMSLSSPVTEGIVSAEDTKIIKEAAQFFQGKTCGDVIKKVQKSLSPTWFDDLNEAKGLWDRAQHPGSSGILGFEKMLKKGGRGIIDEAEANIERFSQSREDDPEKLFFWQSLVIAWEGMIGFARRYSELARKMAASESDTARLANLERIAEACQWVPENPARTFFEAVQAVRLVHAAVYFEWLTMPDMGRLDQYLYPYLKADLEEGRLTLEEAGEIIGDLLVYIDRHDSVQFSDWRSASQGKSQSLVTIGGVKKDGTDACNELTYLILHEAGVIRGAEPVLVFRWHPDLPHWILLKALETNRKIGGANPQFESDKHGVNFLTNLGFPVEDARDYAGFGCSQIVPSSQRKTVGAATEINTALLMDLALHNGVAPRTGKRIGIETGDARNFQRFEDVYDAFTKQYEFVTRKQLKYSKLVNAVHAEYWRAPLTSSMSPGCMENGKDVVAGGQTYNILSSVGDRALIDTADSLSAVKHLVFEEKQLTMAELMDALDSDFSGPRGQEIQAMCTAAPKFGNDIKKVDMMAHDVGKFSAGVIQSEKSLYGGNYTIFRSGLSWHYWGGKGVGALPNGRKSGDPLNDGSISPMRGMDKSGPTAVIRSALTADFTDSCMSVFNLKFSAGMVQSPESLEKLAVLLETYFSNGGSFIQFNLLDKKTLLEAKKHPEQYKDLVVRVAGFCTYFVMLSSEVQDDIIARTEQEMA